MTKQIETSIRIKALSETVWDILTDFEKYPQWNPFIKSVKGEVKEGNNI
ncbi:SRPBCC domain-containing protein, partial [Marivirga lumbricoides]